MQFSLNGFLLSISFALDCIERDILGVKLNHGKRVAYNALLIGQQMGMTQDDLVDMVAFSILHDNGISGCLTEHKLMDRKKVFLFENIKKHCTIGEKNIEDYPLLKKERNIILYHHERLDGSGYFHMKGDAIPLKAQILGLADYVDTHFKVNMMYGDYEERVIDHIKKLRNVKFSEKICDSFFKVIEPVYYRLDQEDANIEAALDKRAPYKFLDLDYFQIHEITAVFSRIIDTKSKFTWRHSKGLSEKAGIMAEFYDYSAEETVKLRIAADLHDIGKLLISNDILEAERRLTAEEFAKIQCHTYYTRKALNKISGFEDITQWAANHHEKLNGKGYPYCKTAKELDFNSRLLGCLDIYQALTEDRPYRAGMEHSHVVHIMRDMADGGFVDRTIVDDITQVFG